MRLTLPPPPLPQLERDKVFQKQMQDLQGVMARYRGPLLESAIDLEQRLYHLLVDRWVNETDGQILVRLGT